MQMKKSLQEKLRDLRYNNGNLKPEQVTPAIPTVSVTGFAAERVAHKLSLFGNDFKCFLFSC